ncbi:non-homologous end-joining DNA ligase [Nonomuraea glycinis]|uniref:non-homologous end-joining DNA ligase n=1 Tax=Nonomuraea glycinis TaxID=2047744 RepID=UPI002E12E555|nr:non-homologous end-joining DNA ligase [Nonomuraea glycinis]
MAACMASLPTYAPMLAQLGPLPSADQDAWAVEMKWDGIRALAYLADGAVRLLSRNGKDITAAYPELRLMAGATGRRPAVIDGEIVAFDEAGRPSFGALQPRMHQRNPLSVAELARTVPVTFMAFDILHLDAESGGAPGSTIALPYTERRELLETTFVPGFRWQVPVWFHDHVQDAFGFSRRLGLEGIVCKRLTSPYRPGKRTAEWTKVKNVKAVEVVIGGWKPGSGRRSGTIGSLLLGSYDDTGRLLYVGHVGTGFTQAMLGDLHQRLAPLQRADPPFDEPVPREFARDAHWVEPVMVGEVQFAEVTGDNRLRHPSWRGLRPDRHPRDVRAAGDEGPGGASAVG